MTSVGRAARRWIDRPGLSDSYRSVASGIIERFVNRVGPETSTRKLRARHADEFLRSLEVNGSKPSTLRTVASMLRAFYRYAAVPADEVSRIRRFRSNPRQKSYLREEEIPIVIAACKTPLERAVILTLVSTGVRISEMTAIKLEDIDWDEGWLRVPHGKGDKYRRTRIGRQARTAIEQMLGGAKRAIAIGFRPFDFSPRYGRKIVSQVVVRAKLKDSHLGLTPHSFRRTFGITLLKKGVGIYTIKGYYGHATVRQTEQYLGMSPDDFVDDKYEKRTGDLW